MARIASRRLGRRRFSRPICLLTIGVTVGLGVAGAGAAMLTKSPRVAGVDSLSVRAVPRSQTVVPGGSATFALRVEVGRGGRSGLSGRTRLSVGRGMPAGATFSFSPESTVVPRGTSRRPSKLAIQTSAGTPSGTYKFQVRARRPRHGGKTTITLIVSAPTPVAPTPTVPAPGAPAPEPPVLKAPDAFTISGNLPGVLTPGSEAPLDLSLTNLESADLSITDLAVRVAGVSAPRSDALHPCTPEDFSIVQFSGSPGFTLPASRTATLAELGFSPAEWPRVTMLDSVANQDGCKSASLRLGFTGTATEGSP